MRRTCCFPYGTLSLPGFFLVSIFLHFDTGLGQVVSTEYAPGVGFETCQRCARGSFNASTDQTCGDLCRVSECNACDPSMLPRFGLWDTTCSVTNCRKGYIKIVDASSTVTCLKILEGRWDTISDDVYSSQANGALGQKWPPSLAYPEHILKSPYIAKTGLRGTAFCSKTPASCRRDERSIPCTWPFNAYCIPCAEPRPAFSTPALFSFTKDAQRMQTYEDYTTSRFWKYNTDSSTFSDAVTPTFESQQV